MARNEVKWSNKFGPMRAAEEEAEAEEREWECYMHQLELEDRNTAAFEKFAASMGEIAKALNLIATKIS